MSRKYRSLTVEDRKNISTWYLDGASPLEMAIKIGIHTATIYHELQRGHNGKYDKNMRLEYDPELAQRTLQKNLSNRGRTKYRTKKGIDGQYELPTKSDESKKEN